MKVFGHLWSINIRKVLMAFAKKGHAPRLELAMLPYGEHKKPEHRAVVEAGRDGIREALNVADKRIASQPYLAGDTFTLADIHPLLLL